MTGQPAHSYLLLSRLERDELFDMAAKANRAMAERIAGR